ncbi:GntR family transcriptional regulator [Microbacterium rhizophilus]|uniref:GntR family transcriptional regulator n=1 Tax=Microbacterium rhizophilus TaxID=3138934 RepID=UPI0031EB8047
MLDIPPMRLSDMVAERIASAIVAGSIPAGARVRDQDLADQLGVSRMPVREALQRLQRVGLIETAASRYTRVTKVTPELADATREFAGHYSISAVRMAIARMSDVERLNASDTIAAIAARLEGDHDIVAARRELHALLVKLAGNTFMSSLSSDIGIAIERNLAATTLPLDDAEMVASFRALGDAVLNADADEAERIMRRQYGIEDH